MTTLAICALSAYLLIAIGFVFSLCRAASTRRPRAPHKVSENRHGRNALRRKLERVSAMHEEPATAGARCTTKDPADPMSEGTPDSGVDHVTLTD
jgi:hypothetical protein